MDLTVLAGMAVLAGKTWWQAGDGRADDRGVSLSDTA